jgi:hypothetical protein
MMNKREKQQWTMMKKIEKTVKHDEKEMKKQWKKTIRKTDEKEKQKHWKMMKKRETNNEK